MRRSAQFFPPRRQIPPGMDAPRWIVRLTFVSAGRHRMWGVLRMVAMVLDTDHVGTALVADITPRKRGEPCVNARPFQLSSRIGVRKERSAGVPNASRHLRA